MRPGSPVKLCIQGHYLFWLPDERMFNTQVVCVNNTAPDLVVIVGGNDVPTLTTSTLATK